MPAVISALGRALSVFLTVCQSVIGLLDSLAQVLSGKVAENAAAILTGLGVG